MKTKTSPTKTSICRSSLYRETVARLLTALVLSSACFALSPQAWATCQEGCLTNNNTVLGDDALLNNTGPDNTAIGFEALSSNRTGFANTAIGTSALNANITGWENTANGVAALFTNTTGNYNTGIGFDALNQNTTGISNTATGTSALVTNTTGNYNTANGVAALFTNTTGSLNTAIGQQALQFNTTGELNTATGYAALDHNTTGINNTAIGASALASNVTGGGNTAIGYEALGGNTNGDFNTAIGYGALSPTTGSGNIAIGWRAGSNHATGDHNIYIASEGTASESNTIRIGKNPFNPSGATTATFIQGISGATVPTGVAVVVDAFGHLGTTTSSARFKHEIKPMDKASEAILALKPVTFRYKHDLDPEGVPQFGLVAEEVEKINRDLVARDEQGKPYSVRYEAVNAMLLNEFLKEHRKVEKLEATVAQQHQDFETAIAELKAQVQKVSAQLELNKPALRAVAKNQ